MVTFHRSQTAFHRKINVYLFAVSKAFHFGLSLVLREFQTEVQDPYPTN